MLSQARAAGHRYSRREFEGQEFTAIVDDQIEFEAKVPTHRVFTPAHQVLADFVGLRPAGMTHLNGSRVNEGDAGHFPRAGVEIAAQEHQTPRPQFDKAVVAHEFWKRMSPTGQHTEGVELLEGAIAGTVKRNHNGHNFTATQF